MHISRRSEAELYTLTAVKQPLQVWYMGCNFRSHSGSTTALDIIHTAASIIARVVRGTHGFKLGT